MAALIRTPHKMNTDLLLVTLTWAVVSSWGAAVAWKHSPALIQSTAALLANMGSRKVGGVWFARVGKFRFSFCISGK